MTIKLDLFTPSLHYNDRHHIMIVISIIIVIIRRTSHEYAITITPAAPAIYSNDPIGRNTAIAGEKNWPFLQICPHQPKHLTMFGPDVTVDCSVVPNQEGAKNWRSRSWICASFCRGTTCCFYCLPHKAKTRQEMWYLICQGLRPFVFISSFQNNKGY